MDTDSVVKIAFSSMALEGKLLKGDERWKVLTKSYENRDVTLLDAANLIYMGHPFTCQLTKPWRDRENFKLGQHLGLDFDRNGRIGEILKDTFAQKYGWLLYETYSSTPENPRCRLIFRLDRPIFQAVNYVRAATSLLWLYSTADPQCKDAARQWWGTDRKNIELIGNTLPLEVLQDIIKRYEESGKQARRLYVPKPFNGKNDDESMQRLERMMDGVVEGERNGKLNEVGFLLGLYIAQGTIDETWGKSCIARIALNKGLDEKEVEYHLNRAVAHGQEATMLNLGKGRS